MSDSNRILTTHVGSLVRTPEIVEAMIRGTLHEPVDAAEFERTLAAGVRQVVRRQADIGIDIVDDGEYSKVNWITYITERVRGLERSEDPTTRGGAAGMWPEQDRFGDFYREYEAHESQLWLPPAPSKSRYHGLQSTEYMNVVCTGPVEYDPTAVQRDIRNLKAALQGAKVVDGFLPVVAPASIEGVHNRHYASAEDFLFAMADVLGEEYRAIVAAGFIVQIDDAMLPLHRSIRFRDKSLAEYRRWAQVRIEALNRALKGIPPERARYHICFGSQNAPHTYDLPLIDFVDLVMKADVGAYSIEASNVRHEHEWQIWKDVKLPAGKKLAPGVIGHATNVVEHPELIAMRLANFAGLVGRENLIASSDCGFSQGWNSPRVHVQVQWAKLEALVEGARLASQRLWR
jgi:5-methyltetrahydropteroyltriglutamate--homocysteine methyltransferase